MIFILFVVSLRKIYFTLYFNIFSIPMKATDKATIKDIQILITNISRATAARYIHQAREYLHKEPHQIITLGEVAEYYGLKIRD